MIDLSSLATLINDNSLSTILIAYILFKDFTTQKQMINTLTELRDLIKALATLEGIKEVKEDGNTDK